MGLPINKKLYDSLPLKKKKKVIKFLKKWIYKEDIKKLRTIIKKEPEGWFASYHHFWGMAVRNSLRIAGYGEKYFKINNLDDINVELVEEAVNEKQFEG